MLVPIFRGKGVVRNCSAYRGVKLLEHAMKIVERVLKRRIQELVRIDVMQCGFIPGRGTTTALFVVRIMQEEYRNERKKLHMCFVDIEKAFNRVLRKIDGVGDEKERFTRINCKSGDEFLSRSKDRG